MALSEQDIFAYYLFEGQPSFAVDLGGGDGIEHNGENNTYWLEEMGWTGLLVDYREDWIDIAKVRRPNFLCLCEDLLKVDLAEMFKTYNVPKVIDYLSIDVDDTGTPALSVEVLKRFPFDQEYDFKFLTIESDLYNLRWGPYQKWAINEFFKDKSEYYCPFENVSLTFDTQKVLEDFYINKKYIDEKFHTVKYLNQNPKTILVDLFKKGLFK